MLKSIQRLTEEPLVWIHLNIECLFELLSIFIGRLHKSVILVVTLIESKRSMWF